MYARAFGRCGGMARSGVCVSRNLPKGPSPSGSPLPHLGRRSYFNVSRYSSGGYSFYQPSQSGWAELAMSACLVGVVGSLTYKIGSKWLDEGRPLRSATMAWPSVMGRVKEVEVVTNPPPSARSTLPQFVAMVKGKQPELAKVIDSDPTTAAALELIASKVKDKLIAERAYSDEYCVRVEYEYTPSIDRDTANTQNNTPDNPSAISPTQYLHTDDDGVAEAASGPCVGSIMWAGHISSGCLTYDQTSAKEVAGRLFPIGAPVRVWYNPQNGRHDSVLIAGKSIEDNAVDSGTALLILFHAIILPFALQFGRAGLRIRANPTRVVTKVKQSVSIRGANGPTAAEKLKLQKLDQAESKLSGYRQEYRDQMAREAHRLKQSKKKKKSSKAPKGKVEGSSKSQ